MIITCAIIDDEPLAAGLLESYVARTPYLSLKGTYNSAIQAMKDLRDDAVNLLFLDIQMPELSGIEFAKILPKDTKIIFTTAFPQYAIEGYKVNAVDYLLKPFGMNDFLRAAMKVQEQYNLRHQNNPATQQSSPVDQNDGTIFVKTDYRVVRISIADIRYIEGMSEYLKIHLEGQKPIITLLSMKKMEDYLPPQQFMRIHRSYIVNLQKIQEVNKNRIILDADTYLPLGDLYKEQFNDYLAKNFLGK